MNYEIFTGIVVPTLIAILAVWGIFYILTKILDLAPITRKSILAGTLCGSLAGVVLGPIAIFAHMIILNKLYGTRFLGLELVAGPPLGAVAFALPGAIIGAIRGVLLKQRADAKIAKPLASEDLSHW